MVYMNTNVTRGTGEFVVCATGMSTEVGHISQLLSEESDAVSPLTKQLATLTNQILVIAGIAVVASIAMNLARGYERDEVFVAAIAFALRDPNMGEPVRELLEDFTHGVTSRA